VATIDARASTTSRSTRRCAPRSPRARRSCGSNINGQRYIGTGFSADVRIEVHGTAGQDLAMFMDGPTVEVFGNAQDGVGNTMNAGKVIVHGDAGDVLGYGMRGGKRLHQGRRGLPRGHPHEGLRGHVPVMVVRRQVARLLWRVHGRRDARAARDGLADRGAARGRLPGHGHARRESSTCAARSSRGSAARKSARSPADEDDMKTLHAGHRGVLRARLGWLDEVLSVPFTKLVPISHRPYGKLYTYV
jgi:hypothetical protein